MDWRSGAEDQKYIAITRFCVLCPADGRWLQVSAQDALNRGRRPFDQRRVHIAEEGKGIAINVDDFNHPTAGRNGHQGMATMCIGQL